MVRKPTLPLPSSLRRGCRLPLRQALQKKYFGGFLHGICEGFSTEITIKCELMPNRTKNYTAPLIVSIKVESSKVSPLPSPKKAGENFIILYFI